MAKKKTEVLEPEVEVIEKDPTIYPILRKSTTFVPRPSDFETPVGESLTIPDHSMDMRDIYDRYVTGRSVDAVVGNQVYHMDEDGNPIEMPNIKALDLVEIGERLEAVRENRELLEHQLNQEEAILNELEAEKAAKLKAEDDERLLKLYEERAKANAK